MVHFHFDGNSLRARIGLKAGKPYRLETSQTSTSNNGDSHIQGKSKQPGHCLEWIEPWNGERWVGLGQNGLDRVGLNDD